MLTDDRPAIDVRDCSKVFRRAGGLTLALDHTDLTVKPRELVCLLGPSGCGKSTLLNIIAGFQAADTGTVTVDGRAVNGPGVDRGILFQFPALFTWLSSLDNVLFGPRAQGKLTPEIRARANDLIDEVGLSGFDRHYPHQLSGGMRHRLAFARALIGNPPILLMDEPFGALDAITRQSMQELLLGIWRQHPMTIVFVTHDVDEAALLSDRVVVMSPHPGRIIGEVSVDIGRPRTMDTVETPAFAEARRQIRSLLAQTL